VDIIVAYVRKLVGITVSTGLPFVNGVVNRIEVVWNTVTGFLGKVGRYVTGVRDSVVNWIKSMTAQALSLLTTLKWIILVAIPREVSAAVNQVRQWVAQLVNAARVYAAGLVDQIWRRAVLMVEALARDAQALTAWARDQVGQLWGDVSKLKDRVFGFLSDAKRLADWLVDAMAHALARWLLANLTRIAQAFWGQRITIILRGAALIEGILARLI
jgi:hypothetical protein